MKYSVLILSHSSELSGGAERSMLDLFVRWRESGLIEPHFIIRKPLAGIESELKKLNFAYTAIHYTNWAQRNPSKKIDVKFNNTVVNAQAVQEIQDLIKKIKPDVVMTNTLIAPWAALAAHYTNTPHVWFVREFGADHGHVFEQGRDDTLKDIGYLSNKVIANSKTLEEELQKYVEPKKLTTLYNPFDLSLIEEKSRIRTKNPYTNQNSLKIVITGRISDSKGQHIAAEAVGRLVKEGFAIELALVGAPSQQDDIVLLERTIKKYNIQSNVHLLGHMSNPLAIVRMSDLGIMPSSLEAFGRVTFEYMALGKPVIGSNSGATPELVIDEKSGLLYDNSNVEDLIRKIRYYIDNPKKVAAHGNAAHARATQMMSGSYSAESVLKKMVKDIPTWKDETKNRQTLLFSRKWLEYGLIAREYISEQKSVSLKRLIYMRLRAKAKKVYLRLNLPENWIRRR